MAFPAKIVYPLPPPTSNCLTSLQRAQLIRSTKKLGRILGTTPHLIDTSISNALSPLRVHLPFSEGFSEGSSFKASTESVSSCSSKASSYEAGKLSRSGSVRSTISRSGSQRSKKSQESADSSDPWPSRQPPMLRLATPSPLETIPASPFPGRTPSVYSHSSSSSIDEHDDQRFTIRPHTDPSLHSSPTIPSFTIPSANSERRNKMERLRRKLGDDVPIDLVFAHEAEAAYIPSPILEEKELPVPPTMSDNQRVPRISSARDSIAVDSPHRARRKMVASHPAPLPPITEGVRNPPQEGRRLNGQYKGSSSLDMRDLKTRLRVIVECPSEHGSSCVEEVGIHRSGAALESEWYGSDDEAEVRSWSTRRGYEGWAQRLGSGEPGRLSYRKRPMTP